MPSQQRCTPRGSSSLLLPSETQAIETPLAQQSLGSGLCSRLRYQATDLALYPLSPQSLPMMAALLSSLRLGRVQSTPPADERGRVFRRLMMRHHTIPPLPSEAHLTDGAALDTTTMPPMPLLLLVLQTKYSLLLTRVLLPLILQPSVTLARQPWARLHLDILPLITLRPRFLRLLMLLIIGVVRVLLRLLLPLLLPIVGAATLAAITAVAAPAVVL